MQDSCLYMKSISNSYLIHVGDDPDKVATPKDKNNKDENCSYLLIPLLAGSCLPVLLPRILNCSEEQIVQDCQEKEGDEGHHEEVGDKYVVSGVGEVLP